MDDGSHVDPVETDGTKGLKVIESGWSPAVGTFVKIVGVVSSEIRSGKMVRVIRFREKMI
jgi:hypothetical protein